jgi:DNA-binding transcriptional regulator YiaG
MTFASEIKQARKGLSLTQADMATLLGVGKRTLEAWEDGSTIPHELAQEGAWLRVWEAAAKLEKTKGKE